MDTRKMIAIAMRLNNGNSLLMKEGASYLENAAAYIEKTRTYFEGILADWKTDPAKGEIHCKYCGARFYVDQDGNIDDHDAKHKTRCVVITASELLE